jgi:hypothetical protein
MRYFLTKSCKQLSFKLCRFDQKTEYDMSSCKHFVLALSLISAGLIPSKTLAQGLEILPSPVIMSGDGCPAGTAQGVFDGDTLSIIFDGFDATANPGRVVSKSCNLRFGMNVPSGYNVQPVNYKFIGFADVPPGGSASINTLFTIQGRTVDRDVKQIASGFSDVWEVNKPLVLRSFNACSSPIATTMGFNSRLTSRASFASPRPTQNKLDTVDITTGTPIIQIKFLFTPC